MSLSIFEDKAKIPTEEHKMLTFICYPKSTTCQKAKALLDSYRAQY